MQTAQATRVYKVVSERTFEAGMEFYFQTSDELPYGSFYNGQVRILLIGSYEELRQSAESFYLHEIVCEDEIVESLVEQKRFMLVEPWVHYRDLTSGETFVIPLRWFALHTVSENHIIEETKTSSCVKVG